MGELATTSQIAGVARTGNGLHRAVADAARKTQVDFDFLLAQARVESNMRPDARATNSTAAGMFQFIESTWLEVLHRHGTQLGLGDIAAQIQVTGGSAQVADPVVRAQLLDLRMDPLAASLMAGALANDNRDVLAPVLGREPQAGELYLAHFLGAGGASRFLQQMDADPDQPAAALFGDAARANRAIFYNPKGQARSLGEVMQVIDGKITQAISANRAGGISAEGSNQVSLARGLERARAEWSRAVPAGHRLNASHGMPAPPEPQPMSSLLLSSFSGGSSGSGAEPRDHVRRAYSALQAFDL